MALLGRQRDSQANTRPSQADESPFYVEDCPPKPTANPLEPTNVLPQVGVALACIGFSLFEVGDGRATPKVYKSPPLMIYRTNI